MSDIIDKSTRHTKLDYSLSVVIHQVMTRLENHYARAEEFAKLEPKGGVYDKDNQTLLLVSDRSSRAFMFKIDDLYPMSGLSGVVIAAIEPMANDDEVSEWNTKIAKLTTLGLKSEQKWTIMGQTLRMWAELCQHEPTLAKLGMQSKPT